jgi:hypothetical protein
MSGPHAAARPAALRLYLERRPRGGVGLHQHMASAVADEMRDDRGTYLISVDAVGIYWNPFKTVALQPGDTLYVKIESLRSRESSGGESGDYEADTFVVAIIPPEQGEKELAGMRYVERGAP